MELDFETVKALSSPTRLRILKEVLERPVTPTQVSEKVGRTKSTVSTHLSKLWEAGLVERDEKKGRRRVVYTPTSKAKTISKGRSRKVDFTILSSSVLSATGIGIAMKKVFSQAGTGGASVMMAREVSKTGFQASDPLFVSGVLIGLTGAGLLVYLSHLKKVLLN